MPDVLSLLAAPLDRSSGLSLAAQLGWRLRRLMGSGDLPAGARLPSARELARAVGVNANTVFSVYGHLEQEGLIESQHGRGSFVLAGAEGTAALIALADETAAAARAAGLDPRELAMSVFVAPETPASASGEADERARRRSLRREIGELEAELARLQPLAAPRAQGVAQPRLRSADELQSTRDDLAERVRALSETHHELLADARARRESVQSSTLEHARPAGRSAAETAPLRVRWTLAWRGV